MKCHFVTRAPYGVYKGLVLMLSASCLMCLNSVVVKSVFYMTAAELAFARYLGIAIFNAPFLIYGKEKVIFSKTHFPTLLARAVFGSASFYLSYLSLKLMPIAESSLIVSSTPLWVALFSRIFLKERLDWLSVISLLLCAFGLVLMSKVYLLIINFNLDGISDRSFWYGFSASLSSAILGALTFVIIRRLRSIPQSVIMAYQSVVGVVMTLVLILTSWTVNTPECGTDGLKVLFLSCVSFPAQAMFTMALKFEKAGIMATVRFSSRVVILFAFQVFLFNDVPDLYTVSAAVCMTISLCLTSLRKCFVQNK